MRSIDRLRGAVDRDLEASGQFLSKFWLEYFLFAERQIEAALELAGRHTGVPDAGAIVSRPAAGDPPALLSVLGQRREAFERQCRFHFDLAWIGARWAAQQRNLLVRLTADGVRTFNAIALAGPGSAPTSESGEPVHQAPRTGRPPDEAVRAPVLVSSAAVGVQGRGSAQAGREHVGPVAKAQRRGRARVRGGPVALAIISADVGSPPGEKALPGSPLQRAVAAAEG